jgi:hypothetical protein
MKKIAVLAIAIAVVAVAIISAFTVNILLPPALKISPETALLGNNVTVSLSGAPEQLAGGAMIVNVTVNGPEGNVSSFPVHSQKWVHAFYVPGQYTLEVHYSYSLGTGDIRGQFVVLPYTFHYAKPATGSEMEYSVSSIFNISNPHGITRLYVNTSTVSGNVTVIAIDANMTGSANERVMGSDTLNFSTYLNGTADAGVLFDSSSFTLPLQFSVLVNSTVYLYSNRSTELLVHLFARPVSEETTLKNASFQRNYTLFLSASGALFAPWLLEPNGDFNMSLMQRQHYITGVKEPMDMGIGGTYGDIVWSAENFYDALRNASLQIVMHYGNSSIEEILSNSAPLPAGYILSYSGQYNGTEVSFNLNAKALSNATSSMHFNETPTGYLSDALTLESSSSITASISCAFALPFSSFMQLPTRKLITSLLPLR